MNELLDYIAIGVGPANLSLAALADARPATRGVHLERSKQFAWHPGLLLPEATIQVSHLKDLVTPVDPASRYSFLAFLVAQGRFYEFVTARFSAVLRAEFNQYLIWVADQLPTVRFGHDVRAISFDDDCFAVDASHGLIRGCHLVVGTGVQPTVPTAVRGVLGPEVFHASELLEHSDQLASARRVAVVGGGQSGAEVIRHLMLGAVQPSELVWISRRRSLSPLDDSAFTNDLFLPQAALRFHRESQAEQQELLQEGKYASDGIDERLLTQIYQARYVAKHISELGNPLTICTGQELTCCDRRGTGFLLTLRSADGQSQLEADVVVLATGYAQRLPTCMAELAPRIRMTDGRPQVREDFSVSWDGPPGNRIYLQNGARHAFGVADPNLSLLAWRSKTILDSIESDRRAPT